MNRRLGATTAIVAAVIGIGALGSSAAGDSSGAHTKRVTIHGIKGVLVRPAAGSQLAAVALVQHCGGVRRRSLARWLRVLPQRGFVTLAVSPRRTTAGCHRVEAIATRYLRSLTYVDATRVHAIAVTDKPAVAALDTLQAGSTPFSPTSWSNAPLAPDAALDSDQSAVLALRNQVQQYGTWVNTTTWSAPVYVVPADQPRIHINVNSALTPYGALDRTFMAAELASVPLPSDAIPAGPPESSTVKWSDHELIVYQPSSDTAWELYHLVKGQYGWSVTDIGVISHASSSNGAYDPWPDGKPHGMTGSGIPLLNGLQRVSELQAGSIDHAVAISIPHVRKGVIRWPATRSDGEFTGWDAIPEGTRFRLPADLDIDSLPLTPYAKIVAKAIQAHGMVVVDRDCRPTDSSCPAVTFKAEDPRPVPDASHSNPYTAIFGGVNEAHLFDNFPWDQLQVLAQD